MATFSNILFHAQSGLRYLVLLVGVIALVYAAVAAARRQPWSSTTRGLLLAFTGLLDLQVLLGVVLVFVWRFYPALWGHIVMMVLAAAVCAFECFVVFDGPAGSWHPTNPIAITKVAINRTYIVRFMLGPPFGHRGPAYFYSKAT